MPVIISTATADTNYVVYSRNDTTAVPVIKKTICIKGGANVAKAKPGSMYQDETPIANSTIITDEDLEILKKDTAFQRHVERGFMVVTNSEKNLEKVVKNMTPKDTKSAPLTSTEDDRAISKNNKVKVEHLGKQLNNIA